ncbi:MAG: alpha/beta fold hydrolase [Candidatus Margulisbacteria bacterium]|nr:alpha/beta fold hydrolase [Candidatus Margulisiibacteriota bacterium]
MDITTALLSPRQLAKAAKRYISRQQVKAPYLGPVITPDKYHLAARVLEAKRLKYKEPVILAHGAFCNSDVWRLGIDEQNFVKTLRDAGFDVIIFDNRGHGRSRSRTLSLNDNFDAIVSDVPVVCDWALKKIDLEQELGYRKIHWVGHSMGAMMFMAYSAAHPEEAEKFASFASMAGPTRISSNNPLIQLLLKSGAAYNTAFSLVGLSRLNPLRLVMEGMLPFTKKLPEGAFAALFLLANQLELDKIDPRVTLKFLADAIEWLPIGLMNSLSLNVTTGRFCSADGKTDYFVPLAKVTVPALFVGAKLDMLVSEENIKRIFKQWGSKVPRKNGKVDKKLHIAKESGHIGVLFDLKVQQMVLEHIIAHSTPIRYSVEPASSD